MRRTTLFRRRAEYQWIVDAQAAVDDGEDPRDWWFVPTDRERLLMNPVVHEVLYWLARLTGMRDRLRCPRCTAVGTFKMHGDFVHQLQGDRPARRWMCKYCGYYLGPEGRTQVFPSSRTGAWIGPGGGEREPTPSEAVRDRMGRTWAWFG
jgi:ribosomal protein S27AE